MALTEYTITIVNKNTEPTLVGDGYKPLVVISPTGITTPTTPYDEYVADSVTVLSGAVSIPAWKKLQYFTLPASSKLVIMTDIADEAIYYQELAGKITNVDITVENAPIVTYKLTFDKTKASVAVGSTVAITPTTVPASQTVTWSSSDETVATVSSGTVTGVKAGTATITGTFTANGITATATCEVTVTGA